MNAAVAAHKHNVLLVLRTIMDLVQKGESYTALSINIIVV